MWGLTSIGRASAIAFMAASRQASHFSTTTALGAKQFVLRYDYIPEVLEKRPPHREGHLALARKMIDDGLCLAGGPSGEPGVEVPTGAIFLFTDEDAAREFVKEDPYVSNGIVTGHSIEEWNVVVQKE